MSGSASARRRARFGSLRFRLTVIVSGFFLVALLTAGLFTRTYLRSALEQDARDAATSLLDDFLAPTANIVPAIDIDELTRVLFLGRDGESIDRDALNALFTNELQLRMPDGADLDNLVVGGPVLLPPEFIGTFGPSLDPAVPDVVVGGSAEVTASLGTLPSQFELGGEPVVELQGSDPSSTSLFTDVGPARNIDIAGAVAVGRDAILGGEPVTVVVASPTTSIDDSIAAVTVLGAIGIPILTALVALITWYATSRTLRPVEAIRRHVERTDPTRLNRHVPRPGGGDEIDRLAGTMNDMLDRLHAASEQHRRFISDASHELRSPITATLATVESTAATDVGDRWAEVAATITTEQHRLQQLVDDLLLLSELDERRGDLTLDGSVDLDELVLAEIARPRSVAVHAHIIEPRRIQGSARLLGRALGNLVDNATFHAATRVDVSVTAGPGGASMMRVDDDGPGVPAADRVRILDRFARLDEARQRRDGGAGLGLAIVHEIVLQHGGSLVIGESPSGGGRFEIVLA